MRASLEHHHGNILVTWHDPLFQDVFDCPLFRVGLVHDVRGNTFLSIPAIRVPSPSFMSIFFLGM